MSNARHTPETDALRERMRKGEIAKHLHDLYLWEHAEKMEARCAELLAALEFVLGDANTQLDYECALIIRAALAKAKGEQ